MKKHVLVKICFCIALLAIATGIFFFVSSQKYTRSIDAESELRLDINSPTHNFTDWIYKAQAMTSDVLWKNGVNDLFSINEMYIGDLSKSIEKDGNGYYVDRMIFSLNFMSSGYDYTQKFNIIANALSSSIIKSPSNGGMGGIKLQTLLGKMDKLNLAYFIDKLPQSDYYVLNYLYESTVLAKSTQSVHCYLVGTDSKIVLGSQTYEKNLGTAGAQVIALSSMQKVADETDKNIGSVNIYIMN